MNNEPVAWIRQSKFGKPIIVQNPCYQFSYQAESAKWDDVPLYTHPAKTLTDEEIYACFHQYFVLGEPKPTHYELEYEDLIDFAKAILRKAQEK